VIKKVKVKCTLVQALRLCTGLMAHRGSRGIALLFLTTALEGGEGSAARPSRSLPPGKDPVPIVQEARWAPWTGAENLAPTGIRSSDRPARSQSLYRLSYPGPLLRDTCFIIRSVFDLNLVRSRGYIGPIRFRLNYQNSSERRGDTFISRRR